MVQFLLQTFPSWVSFNSAQYKRYAMPNPTEPPKTRHRRNHTSPLYDTRHFLDGIGNMFNDTCATGNNDDVHTLVYRCQRAFKLRQHMCEYFVKLRSVSRRHEITWHTYHPQRNAIGYTTNVSFQLLLSGKIVQRIRCLCNRSLTRFAKWPNNSWPQTHIWSVYNSTA